MKSAAQEKMMRIFTTWSTAALLGLASLFNARAAFAQDQCEVSQPMSGQRLLRRLTLDLRNNLPSDDEIEAQRGSESVPDETIDSLLDSEELTRSVMRRYHASLLWPNLEQVQIAPQTHQLYPFELSPGVFVYMSILRAAFSRAAPNGDIYMPCKAEPAQFDAEGNPIVEPVMGPMGTEILGYQEGYVTVKPYWPVTDADGNVIPDGTINVCALDAQERSYGTLCPGPEDRYPFLEPICQNLERTANQLGLPFRGESVACDSPFAILAPDCGCGPDLVLCQTQQTSTEIRTSMLLQMLRIVEDNISSGRPYQEILTTRNIEFNGPLAHYMRYQSRLNLDLFGDPNADMPVPNNLEYSDVDTWVPAQTSGRQSGVLTTPGYLLRFASNRGRAHRFYNAFECSSFIPAGPLPSPFEECSQHEDLTKRCGCDACHKTLEPIASYWGRFAEYGFAEIDDVRFPEDYQPTCAPPYESIEQVYRCFRFYKTDPVGDEVPYAGKLNAYVFRTEEEKQHIEEGPRLLAQESVESGRFSACTAKRAFSYFMRRDPTVEEESTVIPELVDQFESNGYAMKSLIKAIVSLPAYRRLP